MISSIRFPHCSSLSTVFLNRALGRDMKDDMGIAELGILADRYAKNCRISPA